MAGKNEKHFSVREELEKELLDLARASALAIDRGVVSATPVDTGRAKSNWHVSIDKPSTAIDPVGIDTSGAAALAQASSAIAQAKPYQTIYIQNNLPYINRLNNGHSQKAPAKYIEREIERVKNNAKKLA